MITTILIATDFSLTAEHAATYICKLSKHLQTKRIILYYALENINSDRIFITDVLAPDEATLEAEKEEALMQLSMAAEQLTPLISSSVHFEIKVSNHSLFKGINELVEEENVSLLVVGISGKGNQNKNIVGSNTLKLMREAEVPVMVVPSTVQFKPAHKVMLAWDHKDTNSTLPVFHLTSLIQSLLAKLYVVYIDNNSYQTAADIVKESRDLHALLINLNPEVHSPKERSITDGLLQFVDEHDIDIMVIVPKKASFLEDFFSKSSTQKIALRTEIPMLFIRNT